MINEEELIDFVYRTRFEDIPETALRTVKNQFLTIVGTTMAGAAEDGCEEVVQFYRELGGKEEATILIYGGKIPAHDVGFSPIAAASVLGMIGLISSFAKFIFGWLCDIIKVRYTFLITVLLQAIGTSILLIITPDSSMAIIWVYAFAIGAGGGSWLLIMSLYISRSFSMKYYGSLIGIVNFFFCIGVATGPLFAGYIFDIKGSYQIAFTIFLGCYAIAAIIGILSKPRIFLEVN